MFYQIALDLKEQNELGEDKKGSLITKKSLEDRINLKEGKSNKLGCC
jgi:hypothetical protein